MLIINHFWGKFLLSSFGFFVRGSFFCVSTLCRILTNQELDIAGAEIVNDFGVVCLLYADPEQIFLKCWNREKTVGQVSSHTSAKSQGLSGLKTEDTQV
jgi:hypothetical protein